MATPKEKLQQKIQLINDLEAAEILNIVEFVEQKRQKDFDEAFKNVSEVDEPLTDDELKSLDEARKSGSISYQEMWSGYDEI